MTKSATILALLCAATALQGCDLLDILQHKPTKAQRDHEAALARQSISLPADRTPDFTELYNLSPAPITTDPPAQPAPVAQVQPEPAPPPAPVYEYDRYANEPGYVCTAVFRQISCLDDGRPVYLDGQMAQLPFGEHP
jgi:hypothetical protein